MTARLRKHRRASCIAERGFSSIEALIAIALLGIVTAGLTDTIVAAQRARSTGRIRARAIRAAQAGLEQLRAGGQLAAATDEEFDRRGARTVWDGPLGLDRLEVVVESRRPPRVTVKLATLVGR